MSTTDAIPHHPHKETTKSELAWFHSSQSFANAYYGLENWAREKGYDAVVGVRFIECAKPQGPEYWAYGTVIAWEF